MKSERGAMLVMVAVAMLGLLAFSAIVIDYGVMWVSRGQIQNSADAGALAAAISIAFEEGAGVNFPLTRTKAIAVAKANDVWGADPDVQPTDVTLVTCPPGAPGVPDTCVKVNAFRSQERNNPLPVTLATLVGVQSQGVVATATAQVATANTTECLRPWAVLDRWQEFGGPFLPNSTYDRYSTGQGNAPPQENDLYIPPSSGPPAVAGTGYTIADAGLRFAVKSDSNQNAELSPGWFRAIHIPRVDGQGGGAEYRANVGTCGGYPTSWFEPSAATPDCPNTIDNTNDVYWAAHGCFAVEPGGMTGPTAQGVTDLFALEPRNLVWVGGVGGHVEDTANPGVVVAASKRIVPLGVIDIDDFMQQNPNGSGGIVKMVQIYGFFIEGMGSVDANTGAITFPVHNGKAVVGRIMRLQGTGASSHTAASTFLRAVMLVR